MNFVRVARAIGLSLVGAMAVTGASAESLVSALASAYTNSPEIIAANFDAKAAAENIVTAKSAKMPQLSADGSLTHSFSNAGGSFSNASQSSFGLTYGQTLFDNGQTEASVESARAGAEAALELARNTEQTVLNSAAEAYISVALNRKIVALREDTVNFYEAQVQAAKDRLDVGEGTSTDVAQAQAQQASALSDQQSALSDLAIAEANYVRYMGHAPNGLDFSFPFESKLPTSLNQAFSIAETNHPGILASLANVRAAKAGADAAQAAYGPSVTLSGSISDNMTYAAGGTNVVSGAIKLSLSVPLYGGGRYGAAQRKANLTQISSEMTAQNTRDVIVALISQAWSSMRSTAAIIAAVQAAENANRQVLAAVTEEFGVGQKTQLDVLEAKSNLTTIQISKVRAEAGRITAALGLLSAMGRMSASDLGLPVEIRKPDTYRAKVEDIWQELRAVPN